MPVALPLDQVLRLRLLYSHCTETRHQRTKMVKEKTNGQTHKAVDRGGDGENEREAFILSAAIC